MTCVLCGRPLPPLRWWQRVITAPPMCPTRDFEECHQRFMSPPRRRGGEAVIARTASYWMTARSFRDEQVRRAAIETFRIAAARLGYKGRITLDWDDLHGRKRHLVKVSIYP